MVSMQESADAVREAISSTSTCTTATTLLLTQLLLPKSEKLEPLTASSCKLTTPSNGGKKLGTGLRTAGGTARSKLMEKVLDVEDQLMPKERSRLATEVVNAVLKGLGATAKISEEGRRQPKTKEVAKTSARKELRRSTSLPQSPLPSRALNRTSSSPNIVGHITHSPSNTSIQAPCHRRMAECGRIAFAYLRSSQVYSAIENASAPPQLETAMSLFINKLIGLGIDDLAIKELCIMKRRLDVNVSNPKPLVKSNKALAKIQSLSELLEFGNPGDTDSRMELVIATQLQVLKLLSNPKRRKQIETLIHVLQPSHHSSPIRLIASLVTSTTDGKLSSRIIRQLQTLSDILISVCPSISVSEDAHARESRLNVTPETALRLQSLALQARLSWWKFANHQGDACKDLLDPLFRCLRAFGRRSKACAAKKYELSLSFFSTLHSQMAELMNIRSGADNILVRIYQVLSSLSQDANLLPISLEWTEHTENMLNGQMLSDATRHAMLARHASLMLQLFPGCSKTEKLLFELVEQLEAPFEGVPVDMEELLVEVSSLRRHAVSILANCKPLRSHDSKAVLLPETRHLCESLITKFPRFILRYVGKPAEPNSVNKDLFRYEQRKAFVIKHGHHAIDSALFVVRTLLAEGRLSWELMDCILQDCLSLLSQMNKSFRDDILHDGSTGSSSHYVRISHLYFTQYHDMQRHSQDMKENITLRILRRSVDCIRSRPQNEKKTGKFVAKMERLAEFCKSTGRYEELSTSLLSLRAYMVDDGIFEKIVEVAARKPLTIAWNLDDHVANFARVIGALYKTQMKLPESMQMSSVAASWSLEEKGIVLEHVFGMAVSQSSVFSSGSTKALSACEKIFRDIMTVYSQTQYPLRRLRVQIRYLALSQACSEDVLDLIRDDMSQFSHIDIRTTKDTRLQQFSVHLQALATNFLEIQRSAPRLDTFKTTILQWRSILKDGGSWANVQLCIDDMPFLLLHLNFLKDYMEVKGYDDTRTAILGLIADFVEVTNDTTDGNSLVVSYTELADQWLRLGYTGKASMTLQKAQIQSKRNELSKFVALRLHLSFAEYMIAVGNREKSEEHYLHAQSLFVHAAMTQTSSMVLQGRLVQCQTVAAASMICSLLDFDCGASQAAISRARDAIKSLRRVWATLENQVRRASSGQGSTDAVQASDSSIEINIPSESRAAGPCFWPLIGPLFRSLSHLSALYAHHGLFQETLYYAEQALKLAQEVGSENYEALALATLGNIFCRSGQVDKASTLLKQSQVKLGKDDRSRNTAVLASYLGQMYKLLGDPDSAISSFEDGEAILKTLSDHEYITNIDILVDTKKILESKMSTLTISKQPSRTTRKLATRAIANSTATTLKRATIAPAQSLQLDPECAQLNSLRARTLHHKANALLLRKRCEEASIVLQEASVLCNNQIDNVYQAIGQAKHLLCQSIEMMTADPVYSVLQDSTISFPSIAGLQKPEKALIERLSVTRQCSLANSQEPKVKRSRNVAILVTHSFSDVLRQAQDRLLEVYFDAMSIAPVSAVHTISALLNSVAILLSAVGSSKGRSLGCPSFAGYLIETARTVSFCRELKPIIAQADLNSGSITSCEWPSPVSESRRFSVGVYPSDMSKFQRDYIDVLPERWTAISISLSDSHRELSITRLKAGQCPFILRLPLGRNISRDADEDVFGFEQGQMEMLEIVKQANESAHNGGDMSTKEAKVAWWSTRNSLDTRLQELLENIDRVWLGGFTGIFSQHTRRPELLSRFQTSFQNILDKHLPSRQKTKKRNVPGPRVSLDTRILDLFIGLGDASAEHCELSERLTDLLYFVVDILQFHGELNAYAEIDFDSILIETHDALRCYHEAARASGEPEGGQHTILILDKTLQAFPWESLPSMQGLAVSRLPSLSCLRDRIVNKQTNRPDESPEGPRVRRNHGTYILNPSGDLKNTQVTFQRELKGLEEWDGIVERVPSEAEVKSSLESKDLFLYFGHGSGAQYIRSREIKKLSKCAVTFLMGCSSGALAESGEFEPYGPPIQYMQAGSPALVATLWDVTDKDIDKFAMETFQHWGLVPTSEGPREANGKEKKSRKRRDGELDINRIGKVSLVEAVAKGRKACNLRYLNAAAVCVYGVPVYLR